MKNNEFLKNLVRLSLILLAVSAAVALVLGVVNLLTAQRIEELNNASAKTAMQTVLPADSYTELDYAGAESTVNALYQAGAAGWVAEVTESGSQGSITIMVGVNADLTCSGISVTESSETSGLGAIASQDSEKGNSFRAQFVGLSGLVSVTKDGGSVDAISGATITSRAVCRAVSAALNACAELTGAPTVEIPDAETEATTEAETETADSATDKKTDGVPAAEEPVSKESAPVVEAAPAAEPVTKEASPVTEPVTKEASPVTEPATKETAPVAEVASEAEADAETGASVVD